MRTLLSTDQNSTSPSGYSSTRFNSKSFIEPSNSSYNEFISSSRYDKPTPGQSLQIRREDLSPVSKFRQENVNINNNNSRQNISPSSTSAYTPSARYLKQQTPVPKRNDSSLSSSSYKAPYYFESSESIYTTTNRQNDQQHQKNLVPPSYSTASASNKTYSNSSSRLDSIRYGGSDYSDKKYTKTILKNVSPGNLTLILIMKLLIELIIEIWQSLI